MLQTQSHFQRFIDVKSSQVCFFLQAFWHQDLPHRELQLFFWDTLEEWNQIKTITNLPYTRREQVFWHLLQQIHFWPEDELRHNEYLCDELRNCVHYLLHEGLCPFDCIGIRP